MYKLIASSLTLILIVFSAATVAAETDTPLRTITVQGSGSASAPPDQATVTAGVVTRAKTAAEAITENNAQVQKLFAALDRFAIAGKHRQTRSFNVNPIYARRNKPGPVTPARQIIAFEARNQVAVTVTDLDKLGDILGALVSDGANLVSGIGFSIGDTESLLNKARRLAVQDARNRAKLFAEEAGVSLGQVLEISEGSVRRPGPRPLARAAFAAEAVPIARGTQSINARVTLVFAIK